MKILDEIENDTTSFFALLDSILNLEVPSLISFYTSYSSKVLYTGRDYDIDQYGIMSGISYFHKSGIFVDISGSYYSQITPGYNSTNLALGYSGYLKSKLNYALSYEHYFFNTVDEASSVNSNLNNALKASTSIRLSVFTLGVNGTVYFGSSHPSYRLAPQFTLHPKIKTKGLLSKFSIRPTVHFPITDENIYNTNFRYFTARRIINRIGKRRFYLLYNRPDSRLYDRLHNDTVQNVFTLSNVSITLPLRFNHKKWSCAATYNLNFPIALPGEILDYAMTDYFGLSASYNIGL